MEKAEGRHASLKTLRPGLRVWFWRPLVELLRKSSLHGQGACRKGAEMHICGRKTKHIDILRPAQVIGNLETFRTKLLPNFAPI
jgi:hypothetical protein